MDGSDDLRKAKALLVILGLASVVTVVLAYFLLPNREVAPPETPPGMEQAAGEQAGNPTANPTPDPTANPSNPDNPSAPSQSPGPPTEEYYEADLRDQTGVVVTGEPLPYEKTVEGQTVIRFFDLLSQAQQKPDGTWDIPLDEYNALVERWYESAPLLVGLTNFETAIMEGGRWHMVGLPKAGVATGYRKSSGRPIQNREVLFLVRQLRSDNTETYYLVQFKADFIYYGDGRVLISQANMSVPQIKRLDPDLVPQYLAGYGAE